MKKASPIIIALLAILACGGVYAYRQSRLNTVPDAVWRCLQRPQQMTLYSVEPEGATSRAVGSERFHNFPVLGQVSVSDLFDQKCVEGAIQNAVFTYFGPSGCFNPRHALRVGDGENAYDILICFECGRMVFFVGDNEVGTAGIGGSGDVLDEILKRANVPLAMNSVGR
jgi:hypothetical protein